LSVSTVAGKRSRIESLTGVRFIAAFMVFLFHSSLLKLFRIYGTNQGPYDIVVHNSGFLGVSFFFVLSGFVLTWSARESDTTLLFYRRRLLKIYPNHIVTWALAMVLFAAVFYSTTSAVFNFFLLQAWSPDAGIFFGINIPAWSLCCEIFFYLCFPLLLWAVRKIRPTRLWWYAIGVAVLILLMPVIAQSLPASPTFGPGNIGTPYYGHSTTQFWFVSIFPPVRMLDFVLGILMARIVLTGRWINLPVAPALLLLVASYVASLFEPWLYQVNSANILPLALLVAAIATADVRGRRSFLKSPVMQRLGEMSYAFYLLHWSLGLWIKLRTPIGLDHDLSIPNGIAVIVGLLAVTLVASWLLYTYVESPIMRRWSRPRSALKQRSEAISDIEPASANTSPGLELPEEA